MTGCGYLWSERVLTEDSASPASCRTVRGRRSKEYFSLTNLLIPGDMVHALRIPDVAVTTGQPGGVWCDRTWGLMRWSVRYVVRLPFDARAAARLRKRAVLNRVYAVFLPADVLAGSLFWYFLGHGPALGLLPVVMNVALFVLAVLDARWNASPKPSRTGRGDLYLPDLPPAVAQLWLESNPAVQTVDRKPTYRRWPPWVYAGGALVCTAITFGMVKWLFSGADIPMGILFLLPTLVVAALILTYMALPTGHTPLNSARDR